MHTSEIENFFNLYGGRADKEIIPDPMVCQLVAKIAEVLHPILEHSSRLLQTKPIEFSWTKSTSLMASVFETKSAIAIAIPIGVVSRITLALRLLLPYFNELCPISVIKSPFDDLPLEKLYIPNKLRPVLVDYSNDSEYWERYLNVVKQCDDSEPVRSEFFFACQWIVISIVFHELAHVVLQHKYVRSQSDRLCRELQICESDLRRGLELDADRFASIALGSFFLEVHKSHAPVKLVDLPNSSEKQIQSAADFFFLSSRRLSYAITLYFSLFDVKQRFVLGTHQHGYDHPLIRWKMFIFEIIEFIKLSSPEVLNWIAKGESEGSSRCMDALSNWMFYINLDEICEAIKLGYAGDAISSLVIGQASALKLDYLSVLARANRDKVAKAAHALVNAQNI